MNYQYDQLLSLSMFLWVICVSSWPDNDHILFVHQFDGYLAYFHFLSIVSNAAMRIGVQGFVWTCFHFS